MSLRDAIVTLVIFAIARLSQEKKQKSLKHQLATEILTGGGEYGSGM